MQAKEWLAGDVNDALWYRAVFLRERLPLTGNTFTFYDVERAKKRLKSWQNLFEDKIQLEELLQADGLTEQEFLYLLGESPDQLSKRLGQLPHWFQVFHTAFSQYPYSSNDPSFLSLFIDKYQLRSPSAKQPGDKKGASKNNQIVDFLYFAEPLIFAGYKQLTAKVQILGQKWSDVPFDKGTIQDILLLNLLPRLVNMLSRTLVLEFNVARLRGYLQGETPEKRLQDFVALLRKRDYALALFAEYPVLARSVVTTIDLWVQNSSRLLERLCMDWDEICSTFTPEQHPGMLQYIEGEAGDSHQQGQSVMILTFSLGLRLVYKPHSLAVDVHFQQLLRWLNERGAQPTFQLLKVLDHGAYGWAEFVNAYGCTSEEEIQRFYKRLGAYLALLYALQATDFHHENLIASGENPVLIDLESLFHPHLKGSFASLEQSEIFAGDAIASSVMRVMLLPQRLRISREYGEGVELSGIGGAAGQLSPGRVLQLAGGETSDLHFTRERIEMPVSKNRPNLHGHEVDIHEYVESIVLGFSSMYHLLQQTQVDLLASDGPISAFAQDEVRVILRPTYYYARLLQESLHPDLLREALDYDMLFDHLWIGAKDSLYLEKVIVAERRDLQYRDIPIFVTQVDSRDIWTSSHEKVADFFETTGFDLVRKTLQRLSEKDLEKQLWFVRASFTTLSLGMEGTRWPVYTLSLPSVSSASREQLINAACAIGNRLEELAVTGENDTTWIGLTLLGERDWTLTLAAMDLYNGLPGIILYLAYLSKVTGHTRYRELARAGFKTLRGQIARTQKQLRAVGAFNGWGGIIYMLVHLAVLWNDSLLFTEAEQLVDLLPPLIEQDDGLDIINGVAGCIGCLGSLYELRPSEHIEAVLLQCGERLIATAQEMRQGIGWITLGKDTQPLTGFSHGTAGIAWALLKLAAYTHQDRFRVLALKAILYEQSLYDANMKNWPDLRKDGLKIDPDHPPFMNVWCHGAPGIALSRLDTLPIYDSPLVRADIDAALQTTLTRGFGSNHSLCHGDLGNLEVLLQAGSQLKSVYWHQQAQSLAASILASIQRDGWICGVPSGVETPGLMLGLAGIGYQLLRLAEPLQIPAILTLAPPLSSEKSLSLKKQ